MKKVTYIMIYWGDEYGKPAKTSDERAQDEALAKEILRRVEHMRDVKITEVNLDREHYHLEVTGDDAFRFLMETLQQAPHLVDNSSVRVWKVYTTQELASAPMLVWGVRNQSIEDDYYDLHKDGYRGGPNSSHRRCASCRAELEQVRDLMVNTRKMGKRDLSLTYSFEVILSPRLARMLQEAGFTGFTLRPVWHYTHPQEGEPPLYQLVVTHRLPAMASPPTQFEQIQHCPECNTTSYLLKHTHFWGKIRYYEETEIYYTREALDRM
ncbi:MAG: hypothetical protein H5T33_08295, partial [Candidatus Methanosuratus sp.]|nr:hypothetical protein [Candidatus Methanosuratincola sp.]